MKEKHVLLNSLINKTDVTVDVLLYDPDSEYVGFRDKFEKKINGTNNSCSTDIKTSINYINKLAEWINNSGIRLCNGNRLQIRKTKIPVNCTFTYIKHNDFKNNGIGEKETIFIRFQFIHSLGFNTPTFEIYRLGGNDLFINALENFNQIFQNTDDQQDLFLWNAQGVFLF